MTERGERSARLPRREDGIALVLERLWSGWRVGDRHAHGNVGRPFDLAFPVQEHWGALVAFYLYLGATGGGFVFIEVLLRHVGVIGARVAAGGMWIGIALALLSILAIFEHLGPVARWRFYLAFRRPRRSWISRGVIIVTTLVALRVLVALPTVRGLEDLPWAEGSPLGDGLRVLVLAFALAFMLYSGLVISSWNAIAFWNSPLLPILFTGFSFLGGMAALPAVAWLVEGLPAMQAVGAVAWPLVLALLGANGILLALYLQGMSTASRPARVSVRMLTRGAVRRRFFVGVVLLGLVLPAVIVALWTIGLLGGVEGAALLVAAAAAVEVGGYLLRDAVLRVGVYGPPV